MLLVCSDEHGCHMYSHCGAGYHDYCLSQTIIITAPTATAIAILVFRRHLCSTRNMATARSVIIRVLGLPHCRRIPNHMTIGVPAAIPSCSDLIIIRVTIVIITVDAAAGRTRTSVSSANVAARSASIAAGGMCVLGILITTPIAMGALAPVATVLANISTALADTATAISILGRPTSATTIIAATRYSVVAGQGLITATALCARSMLVATDHRSRSITIITQAPQSSFSDDDRS